MTVFTEKPSLFIVARRGDLLEKYGENFRIKNAETGEVRQKIPALAIRDIIVLGKLSFHADIFDLAERNRTPIHFLSAGAKYRASVVFDFSKNVFLRHRQFQLSKDQDDKLAIAKKFVEAKIKNQNTFLQKIRAKGRLDVDLLEANTLDVLRGIEGATARKYFMIWQKEKLIKHPEFYFVGREKRPPTDPVNSLLSFCFSLLHLEIHTQLLIASLDPYTGFLHEQSFGHPALASDFLEIFRGPVEQFVLRGINRREFDPKKDFEKDEGSVWLSRDGYQKFFPKWAEFLRKEELEEGKNLTQLLERDIRKFNHFLMGDSEAFNPFVWKK